MSAPKVGDCLEVVLVYIIPTQEVCCVIVWVVMWKGFDIIVCILVWSRLCSFSCIACGLPADFQCSVNISLRIGILELEDGAIVGVSGPHLDSDC